MNARLWENGWRLYKAAFGRNSDRSMQFVGLLLIINSLAGGAWWVASGRPQMVVLPICVAAMTAGVFLIIHDRTAMIEGRGVPAAQSAGMDELARQTAEAKVVLADLQDQTAAADWHLKQLDEHINAMKILPDGRTRIGNTVTGQAVVLIPKLEALQKLSTDQAADALPLAKECVALYETTQDQIKGVTLVGGDLGPETIGWLYLTAATAAQRTDDHEDALKWARAPVALRSTAERQFLLVTALINKNLQPEANKIIQQQLKAGGPEAAKFRQFLDQYKIPYKN
jgi:hypothetical protein